MILISEIGNNHCGDLDTAKEMIRVSRECGADFAKLQAFKARDLLGGSMPKEFYEQCEMSLIQHVELIEYGKDIGIPVFYSIFSDEFKSIEKYQKWHKIAGSQSQKNIRETEKHDFENTFVSIKPKNGPLPNLEKATILYVSDYMTQAPCLSNIEFLSEFYKRNIGYSDHTIGIEYATEAVLNHGSHVIEKHFTLTRDIYCKGIQFRDAVHGALPYELEKLAKLKTGGYDVPLEAGIQ